MFWTNMVGSRSEMQAAHYGRKVEEPRPPAQHAGSAAYVDRVCIIRMRITQILFLWHQQRIEWITCFTGSARLCTEKFTSVLPFQNVGTLLRAVKNYGLPPSWHCVIAYIRQCCPAKQIDTYQLRWETDIFTCVRQAVTKKTTCLANFPGAPNQAL